jgi:anti-sigma regulatory factor (Ser/Thr protein kinase)
VARGTEVSRFPCTRGSVHAARHFVQEQLGADDGLIEAMVLVSELTANAVEHAQTEFEIAAEMDDGVIHVQVRDWAPDRSPRLEHDHTGPSGRGLHIVDVTADEWGWEVDGDSKVVWFRMGIDRHWPDVSGDDFDHP